MITYKSIFGALAGLAVAGCATSQTPEEREASFLGLTQGHFAETVAVIDDPLNSSIRINTRAGYRDYQFSFGPRDDQFLRAYVPRGEGPLSLQGYVTSEINAHSALQPTNVNFEHTLALRDVTRVNLDVRFCGGSGCLYYEEMVFDITAGELEELISEMERRQELFVRFRIQGLSGLQRDGRFHVSELKAFQTAFQQHMPSAE